MWWLVGLLILFGTGVYGIRAYIYGNDDFWPKFRVPFVEGAELGTLWERMSVKLAFHELDDQYYKKLKTYGPIPFGGIMEFRNPIMFIMGLDLVKNILVKDFTHFVNRRAFGSDCDPTLLHKLLSSMNGQEWKDMRVTLSPAFSTGKIRGMFPVFQDSAYKMINYLRCEVKESEEIELRDVCGRFTMDVIASAAFGVDSQNFQYKDSMFSQMGYKIQEQFDGWFGAIKFHMMFQSPFLVKLFRVPFFDVGAFKFLKDVVLTTIRRRDESGEKRNDVLQLLMELRDGQSGVVPNTHVMGTEVSKGVKIGLTEDLLIAQSLVFFLGGFNTIETMLVYAAYEMACNPDVQNKLAKELSDAAAQNNGELTYDVIINQLVYLDMVVSETLRKYPTATRTDRVCTRDYRIPDSDFEVKKGRIVTIPIWSIHHDADYFPQPDKFIPERFTEEAKRERHPYAYIPFGAGPRNCIAQRFAITEGKTAIAELVHNFVLQPTSKTTIPMKYSASGNMKPINGMWLKVTPRRK